MIDKIVGYVLSGIASALLIVILLIAWGAIHSGLQEVSKNSPEAQNALNKTDEAVQQATTWYFTLGDIEDLVFFIGLALVVGAGVGWSISKFMDYVQPSGL